MSFLEEGHVTLACATRKTPRRLTRPVFLLGLSCAAGPAAAAVIHVNGATGNDAWNGLCSSFVGGACGPKLTIQAGINAALAGDTVRVAAGTYSGAGNVNLDFGGKAILVASSAGASTCTINGGGTARGFRFHSSEGASSVLCGFTITNGTGEGGAIRCESSSPTIRECRLVGNSPGNGAGLYCTGSSPAVLFCTIGGNTSLNVGGGILLTGSSNARIENCLIAGNWAEDTGGGISIISSSPVIRNCVIANNESSKVLGGGIVCSNGTPIIIGCTFGGNLAGFGGGGAIGCGAACNPTIQDCIVWGNTAPQIDTAGGGSPTVTFSDVQGGFAGAGNINADPLYVDADGADNNPATWQDNDFRIAAGSPCINTGDPANSPVPLEKDIDGQRRVWGGRVDMGADERGSFAFGDLNCSGAINGLDIQAFVLALLNPGGYAVLFPGCDALNADCDGSGTITAADIGPFVALLLGLDRC